MNASLKTIAGMMVATLIAGCEPSTTPPATTTVDPVSAGESESSRDFGDYVLHFNAIRTDSLTPEVARTYDITRSPSRVMLNVSMIRKVDGTPGTPVSGTVEVETVNLKGQVKDFAIREIREGEAVYYIGDLPISNAETLVFSIDAVPAGESRHLNVRFQRTFFSN